jgi:5'(3')-deoxyribonucleotidase
MMGRKIIAIDLDGVLADYSKGWQGVDNIGDPLPGAVESLKELAEDYDLIIHTTRTSPDVNKAYNSTMLTMFVADWLQKHKFPPMKIWTGKGKPIADVYIDDRALRFTWWEDTMDRLKELL